MKTTKVALITIFGTMVAARQAASEQPFRFIWHGTGGWGNKSAYCSLFDPKKVESVKGVVLSLEEITPLPGMSPGIEIELKTAKETVPVQLGPRWYLENQDIDLISQDPIEVKGSYLVCNGRRVMAAAEVRKGDQVIQLRDATGRPLWAAS